MYICTCSTYHGSRVVQTFLSSVRSVLHDWASMGAPLSYQHHIVHLVRVPRSVGQSAAIAISLFIDALAWTLSKRAKREVYAGEVKSEGGGTVRRRDVRCNEWCVCLMVVFVVCGGWLQTRLKRASDPAV